MKRIRKIITIMVLLLGFSSVLYAEEAAVSGSASVDILSNYVWRGQKLSNSWVVQPSVGIGYGGFSANIWSNYDSDASIDEGDGHGEFTETDFTLSYEYAIDKLSLGAGYIYYALDGANDTQEFFVSAGYDVLLSPSLTVYYDYDEGNGAFIVAGIGHSFGMMKDISLDIGATAGFNIEDKVMGLDSKGEEFTDFYNGELSAALSIPVTKAISVTPKIAYSFPLSNDAEDAISSVSNDGDDSVLYGGINLTLSF